MTKFYAAIADDSGTIIPQNLGKFCVMYDGKILARCNTEAWSCSICDALNMIDKLAEQAREMGNWPKD